MALIVSLSYAPALQVICFHFFQCIRAFPPVKNKEENGLEMWLNTFFFHLKGMWFICHLLCLYHLILKNLVSPPFPAANIGQRYSEVNAEYLLQQHEPISRLQEIAFTFVENDSHLFLK